MMEESEKRRERLKAMRQEAAQSGVSNNTEGSGFAHGLSNPLIENENTYATAVQYTSPRFDFYTDPMSAFSANKRKNSSSPQVSPMLYNTPPRPSYLEGIPPPAYQHPSLNFPSQRTFQAPGMDYNQSPIRSPMGTANPWGMTQGSPRAWGGSSGSFNHSNPPNLPRGGSYSTDPSNGQGSSPYADYGQGRGYRHNSISSYGSGPYTNTGRGRGRSIGNSSMSRGSGTSGGRGVGSGSHDHVSAEARPDLYYKKEMIEDPWKMLNPVCWKGVDARDSEKPWLPASIRGKKAKASHVSVSQPSLAEFLARSLKDPSIEAVDSEQGT